jgi:integrase
MQAEYVPVDRNLAIDEFVELLLAAPNDRKADLLFFVLSGARANEHKRAKVEYLFRPSGDLFLDGTKTTNSKREVPFLPQLRAVLVRLAQGKKRSEKLFKPWKNMNRDIHLYCGKAGIAPATPNDLRRTFCTWLVNAGTEYAIIAAVIGHTSTKMLEMVYGRVKSEIKKLAVYKAFGVPVTDLPKMPTLQ